MKTIELKNIRNTLLFAVSVLMLLPVLEACSPSEPDPDPEEEVVRGYVTDVVKHTHKVGGDPCPQPGDSKAQVFCYKGEKFNGTCDADSAVISNPSTGFVATFEANGKTNMSLAGLTQGESTNIVFSFTCAIAQSFEHTYTLLLYKDGVLVEREDFKAIVTVVQ